MAGMNLGSLVRRFITNILRTAVRISTNWLLNTGAVLLVFLIILKWPIHQVQWEVLDANWGFSSCYQEHCCMQYVGLHCSIFHLNGNRIAHYRQSFLCVHRTRSVLLRAHCLYGLHFLVPRQFFYNIHHQPSHIGK